MLYFLLINWHANCNQQMEAIGLNQIEPQESMYEIQAHNFQMLYTVSYSSLKVVLQNAVYLLTLFLCVYVFKRFQTQASRHGKSNVNPKIGLSLRIWLALITS